MSFDDVIDRRGTHCSKWDRMEANYGVSPDTGLSMWVADMEFRPPDCVTDALQAMLDHGVFGYFADDSDYKAAICWWMENRHGWRVNPDWVFTTFGLVNGTAMCLDAFSKPGDAIVLFTPVYHAFARTIKNAGRTVREMPLVNTDGRYEMDFNAYDGAMTGRETMVILCSPHNPGGRVWTKAELEGIAAFAKRHDLILVSDEIHHDLTFGTPHIPTAKIAGLTERLVTMTAPSKTFNIAGSYTGQVIIEDETLRARFASRLAAMGMSANSFGLHMTTAAYSPDGAIWVDGLIAYLDENRKLFDAGINAIPGLKSMPLEATYLAWVDFSDTGMARSEFTARTFEKAGIAANSGPTFGTGGNSFLRFNFAMPKARIEEAVTRMQAAFSDLQ